MADNPVVDEEYISQIEKARRLLRGIVTSLHYTATFQILAWLDASNYDVNTNTGGASGSVRQYPEVRTDLKLKHGMLIFENLKIQYPRLTYADLIQLGGVVAVEVIGGPTIEFVPGRKDSLPSSQAQYPHPPKGVRNKIRRMGLSASDLVALAGAWAVSREHREKLEHDDLWYITTPLKFDNSYFAELLEDERQDRVILPGYKFLLEDPYRPFVEQYAEDEDAFFRDYAEAHKKFSELGFTPTPTSTSSEVQVARDCVFNSPLTQSLVLVAFGYIGAVMVLSYFFELKRKTC